MPVYPSTRHEAVKRPYQHVFIPRRGFIEIRGAETAMVYGKKPPTECRPPSNTRAWSWHNLKAPTGETIISFQWQPEGEIWVRLDPSARRLGFHANYLSSHGWSYVGPAVNRHGGDGAVQ
jgi:hypothetical protein